MKLYKRLLILIVGVAILVSPFIFRSSGSIASYYSHHILTKNSSILNDINLSIDIDKCKYNRPRNGFNINNPELICTSDIIFNNTNVKQPLMQASQILKEKGWSEYTGELFENQILFFKDDLGINILPYLNEKVANDGNNHLLITLFRMSVINTEEILKER